MTTLNGAFEWQLTMEYMGYESGIESLSVPIPLCWDYFMSQHKKFIFCTCHS